HRREREYGGQAPPRHLPGALHTRSSSTGPRCDALELMGRGKSIFSRGHFEDRAHVESVGELGSTTRTPPLARRAKAPFSRLCSSWPNSSLWYEVKFDVFETGSYGGSKYTASPAFARSLAFSKSATLMVTPRSASDARRRFTSSQIVGFL